MSIKPYGVFESESLRVVESKPIFHVVSFGGLRCAYHHRVLLREGLATSANAVKRDLYSMSGRRSFTTFRMSSRPYSVGKGSVSSAWFEFLSLLAGIRVFIEVHIFLLRTVLASRFLVRLSLIRLITVEPWPG